MDGQNVALAGVLGDDIKHVLTVRGLNLTGVAVTFELSAGPEQPAIFNGTVNLLQVLTDDDNISTSIVEVFGAAAAIRTAVNTLGGLPGNEPLPLFYQLKFARIPGDLGTPALTTILFGDYTMKGEVNG